jgi:hypothetical protein
MSNPLKPKAPMPAGAPFDSEFPREESHVRPSGERRTTPPPASTRPRESMGERNARIEQKMQLATAALKELSPTSSRARLLASALLRRDEVLLDAVLAEAGREEALLATRRPNR